MHIIEKVVLESGPLTPASSKEGLSPIYRAVQLLMENFRRLTDAEPVSIQAGYRVFEALCSEKSFERPTEGDGSDGWWRVGDNLSAIYLNAVDQNLLLVGDDQRGVSSDATLVLDRSQKITFTVSGRLKVIINDGLPVLHPETCFELVHNDDVAATLQRIWALHGDVEFTPELYEQAELLIESGVEIDWQQIVTTIVLHMREKALVASEEASK